MKTVVRILLGVLALLVAVFVILGLTGEKTYDVSRSVQIDATPEAIWPYVVDIQKHTEWSPWAKRDPEMKNEYLGTMGEVGSLNKWEGPESGVGEQEVTAIDPYKSVETDLRFKEPMESESDAYINLEPNQRGTEVTWGFKGENNFVARAMFTIMSIDLDEAVGKDYEEGLAMLKDLSEKKQAEMEAQRAADAQMQSDSTSTEEMN